MITERFQQARNQAGVGQAVTRATDQLLARHADLASRFSSILRGYADHQGRLTPAFFENAGGIKRAAFAQVTEQINGMSDAA